MRLSDDQYPCIIVFSYAVTAMNKYAIFVHKSHMASASGISVEVKDTRTRLSASTSCDS